LAEARVSSAFFSGRRKGHGTRRGLDAREEGGRARTCDIVANPCVHPKMSFAMHTSSP
jgi:hypothetical protein